MEKINNLKPNNVYNLNFLVERVHEAISANGKTYLVLTAKDNTGTIDCRIWEVNEKIQSLVKKGAILNGDFNVISYRNALQAKVVKIKEVDDKSVKLDDFVMLAPINVDEYMKIIYDTINDFEDADYKKLMLKVLKKHEKHFSKWPAALKVHHALKHGLLMHTTDMLNNAKFIANYYKNIDINKDLLFAGVILHDFGKILEIDENSVDFTIGGKLIAHISLMVSELQTFSEYQKMDITKQNLLSHMIIASHGKKEFGSPVEPAIIEAELLSIIDNLDAKLFIINQELKNVEVNNQTKPIKYLENRFFYKHYKK
ncbi:HD domain-containing protein [Spiroplasma endosymbiont of Anurida maritima]|uniref:3'-5' exoribonuclease YhaM family protein n=1 Tax=Spiroplasma endosymbiont of Anurida maritima TaxID=2967972 RepID=UPI0036D34FC9